jgi:ABC-type glutathione transport system ATPase component
MPEAALLRIRNLTIRYGPNIESALRDVSLDLASGEGLGLLGASASGKTTLALALLGLLPADARIEAGSIEFNGREISALSERQWQHIRGSQIALVFQEPELALNPVMTVGSQISEVLRAHRTMSRAARRSEVTDLLTKVGLTDSKIYSSYPVQLSGGQRQRVVIAQAIACRPLLLIADEPTSSLDTLTQSEILKLITGLRRRDAFALLFITHNPLLLPTLTDRVAVLHKGQIAEVGSTASILSEPQHARTRELLNAIPLLPDENR